MQAWTKNRRNVLFLNAREFIIRTSCYYSAYLNLVNIACLLLFLYATLSEIKRDFPMEFPFFDSKT